MPAWQQKIIRLCLIPLPKAPPQTPTKAQQDCLCYFFFAALV